MSPSSTFLTLILLFIYSPFCLLLTRALKKRCLHGITQTCSVTRLLLLLMNADATPKPTISQPA
jgi:hypothetical protein